jgi:hypothetical protein
MLSAAVVTVTLGRDELEQCIESIDAQTHPVTHYVLCDGAINYDVYQSIATYFSAPNRHFCYWPTKIGGKDLEGRRWLAAASFLVNEDVTFFCNDDDWFDPDHVASLMSVIEQNHLVWAHSLRKIHDKEGNYLFDDKCEALGELHDTWNNPGHRFVDWCMWGMRTPALRSLAQVLAQKGWGIDRQFYAMAREMYPAFGTSGLHSFNFRLGGNDYSVTERFFEVGHQHMKNTYPDGMPWEAK